MPRSSPAADHDGGLDLYSSHLTLPRDAPVAVKIGVALVQLWQLLRARGTQRRGGTHRQQPWRLAVPRALSQPSTPACPRATKHPHRRLGGAAAARAVARAAAGTACQRDERARSGGGRGRSTAARRVALLITAGCRPGVLACLALGRQCPAAAAGQVVQTGWEGGVTQPGPRTAAKPRLGRAVATAPCTHSSPAFQTSPHGSAGLPHGTRAQRRRPPGGCSAAAAGGGGGGVGDRGSTGGCCPLLLL